MFKSYFWKHGEDKCSWMENKMLLCWIKKLSIWIWWTYTIESQIERHSELLNQSLYYVMNAFTNGIFTPPTLLYLCVGTTECIKQVPGFLLSQAENIHF